MDLPDHLGVVRQVQVDVVERQVGIVEPREIRPVEGTDHLAVQFLHADHGREGDPIGDVAECGGFERGEDLVDVADPVQRERGDANAAAAVDLDEPLAFEPQQGVAQRRAADADLPSQRVQVEVLAGAQASPVHEAPETLVHLLAEGPEDGLDPLSEGGGLHQSRGLAVIVER